jgi:hypothetical protein
MNKHARISIQDVKIGDSLKPSSFTVIKDYKKLDFPYKEVALKNDTNVILKVIGENNIIFEMRRKNLSDEDRMKLTTNITDKLDIQPDSSINVVLSDIWRCNMYIWTDPRSHDEIMLSTCVHKSEDLNLKSRWELKINNDTILNLLDKKYNQFH